VLTAPEHIAFRLSVPELPPPSTVQYRVFIMEPQGETTTEIQHIADQMLRRRQREARHVKDGIWVFMDVVTGNRVCRYYSGFNPQFPLVGQELRDIHLSSRGIRRLSFYYFDCYI
jgi:hypothetical protein